MGNTTHEGSASTRDAIAFLQTAYPKLVKTARAVGGTANAEDIVQDALVEVLRRYPDFVGIDEPLPYIRTVILRLVWRQGRRAEVPLDHVHAVIKADEVPVGAYQEIVPLLRRLGPRQRTCVFLRFVYGLSDNEIAHVLECRPVTVRSQIARGLQTMSKFTTTKDFP